ncbi:MAG: hypothetical protein M1531_12710 [Chloroflexi bacterium]|nr:hypothetical protein [Chloroflexota bacterium]
MSGARKLYYQLPHVRSRIAEYCGGPAGRTEEATARFLVGDGVTTVGLGIPPKYAVARPSDLDQLLSRGVDVFRSLWDRCAMLAILDVDYQNASFQDQAFYQPAASFQKLEPVFQSVREELADFGIDHLALMTGQGYHFIWSIADGSPAGAKLQRLADLPSTLEAKYAHDHPFTEETVPLGKGRAHAGLGLLMEYLAHKVLRRAAPSALVPTMATGLVVGGGNHESVSLDLSAYGDPLYMRYSRCAFSLYLKVSYPDRFLVCLPRAGQPWADLLPLRGDPATAAECAAEVNCAIPEASSGTLRLLDDYLASDVRCFHQYFASGWHDDPSDWPSGYDRLDLGDFSPCVAWPMADPNDALAKPTNIQNVARVLVSQGWHPRAVAGLIRSRFERDFGWGINWLSYDAAARADFYVRLFCGLVAAGVDDLRDLNCVSHQEKGFCPKPWCGFNLASYQEPLLRALRR